MINIPHNNNMDNPTLSFDVVTTSNDKVSV